MQEVYFVLIGIAGGILAGMGMGGGTLLIPMLVFFMGVSQISSQGINLIAFIPMAIVALIIHFKNKLINFKVGIPILISGTLFSILGAQMSKNIEDKNLSLYFGIFLIVLGIFQLVDLLVKVIKK